MKVKLKRSAAYALAAAAARQNTMRRGYVTRLCGGINKENGIEAEIWLRCGAGCVVGCAAATVSLKCAYTHSSSHTSSRAQRNQC